MAWMELKVLIKMAIYGPALQANGPFDSTNSQQQQHVSYTGPYDWLTVSW
jgi:hypothetical protein